METVSPNLYVRDLATSVSYYEKLGFHVVTTVPDETGQPIFALMMNGDVTFMFQTIESLKDELPVLSRHGGGSLLLYVKMKGIRAYFEKVKGEVNVISGLQKMFYGATEFLVLDPDNFVLTFAEDE